MYYYYVKVWRSYNDVVLVGRGEYREMHKLFEYWKGRINHDWKLTFEDSAFLIFKEFKGIDWSDDDE